MKGMENSCWDDDSSIVLLPFFLFFFFLNTLPTKLTPLCFSIDGTARAPPKK